jgi:hypothetical protein
MMKKTFNFTALEYDSHERLNNLIMILIYLFALQYIHVNFITIDSWFVTVWVFILMVVGIVKKNRTGSEDVLKPAALLSK